MGLFGGIMLGSSKGSSSTHEASTFNRIPYDPGAVETIKKLQQQGLDLTSLLKGTTDAQQLFQTGAFNTATGNLAGTGKLTDALYTQALDQTSPTEAANKAETDVLSAIGKSNEGWMRDMGRFGINPNAMASNARVTGLETAKGIVGARAAAEETAKDQNLKRIIDAINASNSTLNTLTGYDPASGVSNAMDVTTRAAEKGLKPKSETTDTVSRTSAKKTSMSAKLGLEI